MSNTPCTKPEVCGVQTHRPGTVALCMTASNKGGSAAASNLAGAPKLSSASTQPSGIDYSELEPDEVAEAVVDHHGIYVAEAHNEGLQFDEYKWEHTRWELKLEAQNGESFPYTFCMGTKHGDQTPQPEQVIDNMIQDAQAAHRFSSPMAYGYEMGYDLDDPEEMERTKKSFKKCQEDSDILKRVLGEEEHEKLISGHPTVA